MNKKKIKVIIIFLIILICGAFIISKVWKKNTKKNLNSNKTSWIDYEIENQEDIPLEISENAEIGDYFILYNGYEMKKAPGVQFLDDMKYNEENIEKYNRTYYNFEQSKYKGEKFGRAEKTYEEAEQIDDSVCVIQNVSRIAISEKYNAIPREVRRESDLPNELIDMSDDYSEVKIDSIDLDGNGKEEHIVCWRVKNDKEEIEDKEPKESSGMMLFDSEYNKISDLVTLQNGFVGNSLELYRSGKLEAIELEDVRSYVDLDTTEYIDIDNDGIMEIIVEIPVYEGEKISVLKYDNGKLMGETNVQASVNP